MILGALIGDYIGSVFEIHNTNDYNFELYSDEDKFTDDSVLTVGLIDAFLTYIQEYPDDKEYKGLEKICIDKMIYYAKTCSVEMRAYGKSFAAWLDNPVPYESIGNGAAMRISGAGLLGRNEEEVKRFAKIATDVSHNHPDSEKAAEVTALSIYYLKHGHSKGEVIELIKHYYPNIMDIDLDALRPVYKRNITCEGSVPIALKAFIDSSSFEDALRKSISMGGDSDTIAAICCSLASEYYSDAIKFWDKVKIHAEPCFNVLFARLDKYM